MKAKKRFGQNFITDKNLIKKIINLLGEDKDKTILEIGPGKGALTKFLVDSYHKVIAIEIDRDMENILKSNIQSDNFHLIIDDFLNCDLGDLIKKENYISLISNTPYYITSEIIFRTLFNSELIDSAVFMVQKEVAKRICAKVNENNYNNLSIACQFFADVKYEFTVGKKMFNPMPKVDSAIISLKFHDKYISSVNNPEKFIATIRTLFNNKRKTILNNLTTLTNDKDKSNIILNKINIENNLRPENISLVQFIDIYKELYD